MQELITVYRNQFSNFTNKYNNEQWKTNIFWLSLNYVLAFGECIQYSIFYL